MVPFDKILINIVITFHFKVYMYDDMSISALFVVISWWVMKKNEHFSPVNFYSKRSGDDDAGER